MNNWQESNIKISDANKLLLEDYEIEVDSPDGWVPVVDYVDKGMWQEYILTINGENIVRCNESHLFETPDGWKSAKDLCEIPYCFVLNNSGEYVKGHVTKSIEYIPIVDIQVDHPNHRYYTNGISSHNTNVGKSLAMCSMATSNLMLGKNVLYITCEMAEERIAERIDANSLDITIDTLRQVSKKHYLKLIDELKNRTVGKLVIKEYPTGTANVSHFRYLLHELAIKKNFVPDIIYIDYLNICASSRIKNNGQANSYTLVKSIAEEVRGLAVEIDRPIITASQFTRSGASDSDADMSDIAESFGVAATADFMIAIINTEELETLGQLMVKQLKNRYNDVTKNKKFLVGVDRSKMRLFDIGDIKIDTEGGIADPYEDNFGSQKSKYKKNFDGFKF